MGLPTILNRIRGPLINLLISLQPVHPSLLSPCGHVKHLDLNQLPSCREVSLFSSLVLLISYLFRKSNQNNRKSNQSNLSWIVLWLRPSDAPISSHCSLLPAKADSKIRSVFKIFRFFPVLIFPTRKKELQKQKRRRKKRWRKQWDAHISAKVVQGTHLSYGTPPNHPQLLWHKLLFPKHYLGSEEDSLTNKQ